MGVDISKLIFSSLDKNEPIIIPRSETSCVLRGMILCVEKPGLRIWVDPTLENNPGPVKNTRIRNPCRNQGFFMVEDHIKVIRKFFFLNHNKSFRWHLGNYEKYIFCHLSACERRNFDFCVFLRMCSGSC